MFSQLANRRKNRINADIRKLVDNIDALSERQYARLDRLDRAHEFWSRLAD